LAAIFSGVVEAVGSAVKEFAAGDVDDLIGRSNNG